MFRENRILQTVLVGLVAFVVSFEFWMLLHNEPIIQVCETKPVVQCDAKPFMEPIHYTICDGERRSLNLTHLNVTLHVFEFTVSEANTKPGNLEAQILAFVEDIYIPIVRVHSFGVMSNQTKQMEFTGRLDSQTTLTFTKKVPFFESGMLLTADLGKKEEFLKKYPHKLDLEINIIHNTKVLHNSIHLSTCPQSRKHYNIVSVHKPLYGNLVADEHLFEWIAHHLNVGVEHFLIYGREAKCSQAVQNLIDAGLVTWQHFPQFSNFSWVNMDQEISYTHAMMRNRYNINWMLIHDADEFLVSHGVSIPKALENWICEPAVEVLRVSFCSRKANAGKFQFEKYIQVLFENLPLYLLCRENLLTCGIFLKLL